MAHETQDMSCVSSGCLSGSLAEALPEIIRRTLPSGPGQRHRQIFEFARWLRRFPELADKHAADLVPYVRQWYTEALPFIRTKDFETTYADFAHGWAQVRYPAGAGTLTAALSRAKALPLPSIAEQFRIPQLKLLVALCRELQRQGGDRPFFLACRDAAELIGLGMAQFRLAWRWLRMLCDLGILRQVSSGALKTRRSNEYLYLAID
jgi:hypothetical protein